MTHKTKNPKNLPISRIAILLLILVFGLTLVTSVLAAPIFTGNAVLDFNYPGNNTVPMPDQPPPGIGDVGIPQVGSPPPISGWDIQTVFFDYDPATDIMYIGVDCGGTSYPTTICGDADADGDAGVTSPWLADLGGLDLSDLRSTESMALLIDSDLSGDPQIVIGVSDSISITGFAAYNRMPGLGWAGPSLGFSWLAQLPNTVSLFANPNASAPDLEFSVANFSSLPGFSFVPGETYSFDALYFAGSQTDAGIGEDYVPGSVGTTIIINGNQDFGDLVDPPYSTTRVTDGPRHVLGSLYLGDCVDDEYDGQPNTTATGDDLGAAALTTIGTCAVANDDDDGAYPFLGNTWGDGSGQISYTVTGGSGCLIAWIDWDGDGDFDSVSTPGSVSELVINQSVSAGSSVTIITTPTNGDYGGTYPPSLNALLRLFQTNDPLFTDRGLPLTGGCPTNATEDQIETIITGLALEGEVETHQWSFNPTAVTLTNLKANNKTSPFIIATITVTLLLASGGVLLIYNRRRV